MRVGIAHHLGWAVAVTVASDFEVSDRRRIELIEEGLPSAPIHHEGGTHEMHRTGPTLDDDQLTALVATVRTSAKRMADRALDALDAASPEPISALALRKWSLSFPTDIATQRRPPHESRADSVMYCQVLAAAAERRGWQVLAYDLRTVEADAAAVLGARAHDVLFGPRTVLGPPWSRDHRVALAGTIVGVPR
jgi:hypothetical protein